MTEYANPNALVETGWLEAHLLDPAIRIIEVDEDTKAYRKGHIPGAAGWNWWTDLRAPLGREHADQAGLQRLLGRAEVMVGTTVVLYGGNGNLFATYAYWLLRLRGYEHVRLLNGGRRKWELDGRELTRIVNARFDTEFRIRGPERPDMRALRGRVLEHLNNGVSFVDARSPEEYRGELVAPPGMPQELAQVPGHIPGAINVPWAQALNEDGTFRSAEEIASLYERAGVTRDREVIAYCRIGERSSLTWFALSELLGHPAVRNYDGSWTEYGSMVGVPVERSTAAA